MASAAEAAVQLAGSIFRCSLDDYSRLSTIAPFKQRKPSMNIGVDVLSSANTRIIQALINKLVAEDILTKDDLADIVNTIERHGVESNDPQAAGIKQVVRQLFVLPEHR